MPDFTKVQGGQDLVISAEIYNGLVQMLSDYRAAGGFNGKPTPARQALPYAADVVLVQNTTTDDWDRLSSVMVTDALITDGANLEEFKRQVVFAGVKPNGTPGRWGVLLDSLPGTVGAIGRVVLIGVVSCYIHLNAVTDTWVEASSSYVPSSSGCPTSAQILWVNGGVGSAMATGNQWATIRLGLPPEPHKCIYEWYCDYDPVAMMWGTVTDYGSGNAVACDDPSTVTQNVWIQDPEFPCRMNYYTVSGCCFSTGGCAATPSAPSPPATTLPCCSQPNACIYQWYCDYDCSSSTWGSVTFISVNCDDPSTVTTNIWIQDPSLPCRMNYWIVSGCCSEDGDCADAPTAPGPPVNPSPCCGSGSCTNFCIYIWQSTFDPCNLTWSTPTTAGGVACNDPAQYQIDEWYPIGSNVWQFNAVGDCCDTGGLDGCADSAPMTVLAPGFLPAGVIPPLPTTDGTVYFLTASGTGSACTWAWLAPGSCT